MIPLFLNIKHPIVDVDVDVDVDVVLVLVLVFLFLPFFSFLCSTKKGTKSKKKE